MLCFFMIELFLCKHILVNVGTNLTETVETAVKPLLFGLLGQNMIESNNYQCLANNSPILRNLIGFSTENITYFVISKLNLSKNMTWDILRAKNIKMLYLKSRFDVIMIQTISLLRYMHPFGNMCSIHRNVANNYLVHLIHPNDDNVNKNIVQTYMY